MRGLGQWYTLVLVNGRRMASAPTAGTAVQNLSMIPLAAVERIEVLRDGASAIYGSDALAGVINIILRKDYSGINMSYAIGRPSQSGGDEDSYSITGGISGARGNVTFGMDAQKQDIVYSRDRDFTSEGGLNWFGFPSSYWGYLLTDDPRNPTGQFLSIGTFADPRCPAELGTDPDFPWSVQVSNNWGGVECQYAYWGESAREAANDTKSFFVDANYEITDRTQFFTRGIFSYNEVSGRYAPSPVVGLEMSQDAPQNPTDPENATNYLGDAFGGWTWIRTAMVSPIQRWKARSISVSAIETSRAATGITGGTTSCSTMWAACAAPWTGLAGSIGSWPRNGASRRPTAQRRDRY
jgi:iron complex outermembrane receptor protein